MLGGQGIKALLPRTQGRYLGAYHQVAGPLCSRLRRMGASLPRRLAVQLADPDSSSLPWARHLDGLSDVLRTRLQGSFTEQELHLANCIAPRVNLVVHAGTPQLRTLGPWRTSLLALLPLTPFPCLALLPCGLRPQGTNGASSSIGHLMMWRLFFDVYNSASTTLKIKLLTHSGHGSVSCLFSDYCPTYPRVYVSMSALPPLPESRCGGSLGILPLGPGSSPVPTPAVPTALSPLTSRSPLSDTRSPAPLASSGTSSTMA